MRLQKVASTPAEPARATFDALKRSQVDPRGEVDSFIMGTDHRHERPHPAARRAGRCSSRPAGFEDVLYIQRIDRQGLYDLQWVKAEPYVPPRPASSASAERILADGSVRTPLTTQELARVAGEVRRINRGKIPRRRWRCPCSSRT